MIDKIKKLFVTKKIVETDEGLDLYIISDYSISLTDLNTLKELFETEVTIKVLTELEDYVSNPYRPEVEYEAVLLIEVRFTE